MTSSSLWSLLIVTAGATLLGSAPVIFLRHLGDKSWRWWESFGAGVMLSASVFSLFLPAYRLQRDFGEGRWTLFSGAFYGALFIFVSFYFLSKLTQQRKRRKAYLFILAMGLHNVPEGMAVGVDVAALGWREALPLSIAIFIQNLPEGLVSSMTFIVAGFSLPAALGANAVTALIEAVSALGGHYFVSSVEVSLAFLLSFAGSSMSSVVLLEYALRWRETKSADISPTGFIVGLLVCALLDLLL
jgi:zinc transporter, ZIP family